MYHSIANLLIKTKFPIFLEKKVSILKMKSVEALYFQLNRNIISRYKETQEMKIVFLCINNGMNHTKDINSNVEVNYSVGFVHLHSPTGVYFSSCESENSKSSTNIN